MTKLTKEQSKAVEDVIAERARQVSQEGFDDTHDDIHTNGALSRAAACYALQSSDLGREGVYFLGRWRSITDLHWPWDSDWWKPTTPRRNLVKAGALILAEIERLDRRSSLPTPEKQT